MNTKLQEIAKTIEGNPYEASGHIYHPLPFPEFERLKTSSSRRSANRKWRLIERCLGSVSSDANLRVLDVGANAGFYSFNFAKLGASVDAYEPHEHYANIGRQIAEATGLSVRWHNKRLREEDLLGKEYDVALMLSVFQWISQGNEHLVEAASVLRAVAQSTHILFFELGCNQGKSAICTSERPIAWIWRLLQQNTSPKHVAFLGTTSAWGPARRYVFACADSAMSPTPWQRFVTHALQRSWIR
jgi:SAM-dependent methyltransferase